MDILRIALCLGALSLFAPGPGFGENLDMERLTTLEGREFREVLVIDADSAGLLFRHRDGIAKIDFASLPEDLCRRYRPAAPAGAARSADSAAAEGDPSALPEPAEEGGPGAPEGGAAAPFEVTVTVRTSVRLPAGAGWHWHPLPCCHFPPCPGWSRRWRHAGAHPSVLALPHCRALATAAFLAHTGLSGPAHFP